ncbi:MAG: ABC transporter permease [Bacillota bacterium]|nr:ABC transporter permease [Bacillota bacterium]
MNYLADAVWIEMRKAMRSRVPLFTALGYLMMPLASAFLIYISKDPELARKLGLISAKASLLVSTADWPTYLKLVVQFAAIGGFFFFCLSISWVFGREFVDGTLKDLLAVPVPRSSIVLAKFIVVAVWSAALTLEIYIVSLVMGVAIRLPQGSAGMILHGSVLLAVTACMAILLVTPFALFASVGRGYLLPMGAVVLTAILANLVVVTGWGEYFPWSVPGLYAQGSSLRPISYWIVILTGLAGMVGTCCWWQYADQSR